MPSLKLPTASRRLEPYRTSGPSPYPAAASARRLLGFHLCDWLCPTMDHLKDRGMMGDGVIDLRGMRRMMEAAGYRGFHEVEIFSANNWWKRDPDEVLRVCKQRHEEVC